MKERTILQKLESIDERNQRKTNEQKDICAWGWKKFNTVKLAKPAKVNLQFQ